MSLSSNRLQAVRRSRAISNAVNLETLESRTFLSANDLFAVAIPPGATAIAANADAYVKAGSTTTNYGNATSLDVVDDTQDKNDSQAYFRFNLSGLTGNITSATLNLTPVALGSSASSLVLRVRLLGDTNDGWIEGNGGKDNKPTGELNWNNKSTGTGAAVSVAGTSLALNKATSIDVLSLINQSINANGIASFQIDTTSAANGRRSVSFASRENLTTAYRPTLVVTTFDASNQAPTVVTAAAANPTPVTGTTTSLSVMGADDGGEANLTYTWAATAFPAGAKAPVFSANASNAAQNSMVTFFQAGDYTFTATITDAAGLTATSTVSVSVNATFTSIALNPASVSLAAGGTQQFAATAKDQFGLALAPQPAFAWAASAGTISDIGFYTAPSTAAAATITASSGGITGTANVTVTSYMGINDPELGSTVQTLFADGSLSRTDMIQVLRTAGTDDGIVDATELADLKGIISRSTTFSLANYVKVLSGDVVNGNTANANYQGTALGNLAAGSTSDQMNKLVNKWFLGLDRPATTYTYRSFAGSLFVNGPTYTDMHQGGLGDCYYIASMGAIARSNPAAAQNMFIDNGDGTWTVRFYANGVADFVTVDRYLASNSSGYAVYEGVGGGSYTNSGNELWIALAEKAYAQWNETGKSGRSPAANTYASIEGGWMYNACDQVLGNRSSTYWWLPDTDKQTLINGINSGKAVTYATNGSPGDGLYGPHAYVVLSYDSITDTFQLYNPWGSSHPGPLTYAQLRTNGQCFVISDTSGTVAPSGGSTAPAVAAAPVSKQATFSNALISGESATQFAAAPQATATPTASHAASEIVTGQAPGKCFA